MIYIMKLLQIIIYEVRKMKKAYVTPIAEKMDFDYEENVVASGTSGCGGHGYGGGGNNSGNNSHNPWWPWWPWFLGKH